MIPFLQKQTKDIIASEYQRVRDFLILFFPAAVAGSKYGSAGQEPLQPTVQTISPDVSLVMTDAGN